MTTSVSRDTFEALVERVNELESETQELRAENETLRERVGETEQLRERVATLESQTEQLQERVDELESVIDEQPTVEINTEEKEPITTLTVDGLPVGRRIAGSISEYDWEEELRPRLEAELEVSKPTPEAGEPIEGVDELTHIERISKAAGDDIESVTDSVDARRAVALWRHLPKWGKKTPKGYCLRPKDNPKQLLEADQDEDLAWKQYYRAAEALEGLSEGAVTFFDSDKHGKMLVLHEQSTAFDRVRASLTASTAHAEG